MFQNSVYFLIFFQMLSVFVEAQEIPSIQLDRPDQTECPYITPKKYIQIESGFTYEKVSDELKAITLPTVLYKYGINDHFELRMVTEIIAENNDRLGFSPINIGFKTAILEEHGLLPKLSFIGHLTVANRASKTQKTTSNDPAFRFSMLHTLSPKATISYNLGTEWLGSQQTNLYTLSLGLNANDKIGFYAELYGFKIKAARPDHRFDAGLTYLISKDFIVDFSGGLGLSQASPKHYLSAGISYRFKTANVYARKSITY